MANVVWKEWGYLDLAKNPFWSHFLANDHLLFSSQWRSVTLFFVTEWNALFSWYDQNESLSIRINFNEWKSNKSYRELPLNWEKMAKQCCQLYLLDAKRCFQMKANSSLFRTLFSWICEYWGTCTSQNFKLKLATLN